MSAAAFFKRMLNADGALLALARLRPRSLLARLVAGLVCALAALAIRGALSAWYGGSTGFVVMLPGVLLAALAAGRLAGFVSLAACLAGGCILVGGAAPGLDGLVATLAQPPKIGFLIVGVFVIVVGAALRQALAKLEDSLSALRVSDARIDETEGRLQLISELAPAMLWMSDETGRCIHLNRDQRLFWDAPPDLAHFDFSEQIHPDDRARVLAVSSAAMQAHVSFEVEGRHRRHDGEWRVVQTHARPRIDREGRYLGMIGVNTDVTAARAAEAAVRESETRFRLMADTAPSPVWLTNAEGEVEFANAALSEFYHRPAEAIHGHIWRDSLHPDDVDTVNAAQADARPRRLPYGFEARFRHGDGTWRWMRVAVNPRFDGAGAFLGYVGMSFDITDTRKAIDEMGRQERRQTFLLDLIDRIRDMADPDQILEEIERSLGDVLDADRVGYGEVDHTRGVVFMTRDWTAGVVSARGHFDLNVFGERLMADLAAGRTAVIGDIYLDDRTADARSVFDELHTRALIRAPLIRGSRLRAFLYVHSSEPRVWSEAEIDLVEEVAARTWTEVERARAEQETRESEERFRAIADTAPVLIWVTQQDRQRAFVNQAYIDFHGHDYETVRTADWRAYLHPDDQARILEESIAGEATGKPFSLEARYLRHDGEWRWLKSFSRPRLSGGDVVGFVGVAFDVTDMREAQDRLAESETRFRTAADSAPALIWMTDDAAQLSFGNRRYRTFFGVRSQKGLADAWRRLVHPDDETVFAAAFMRAFEARDRFEAQSRVVHPTLGLRWLRTEGVPRFDASGVFQGYVGASIDVTDAKRAEEDLKRINELLEERVGEALMEKAKAEADLMHAQRMEAVGRLTGGVAHDFNNLLTVVIGALDIMLRSGDEAKRRKLGEAALSAARRGERLTHQLLAFSRRQALRPEAIDLNGLIRECEPLLRRAVGEAVEFKIRLKRGGARVNVDPAQFEAALLNLAVNARDALGDVTGGEAGGGGSRHGGRVVIQTMHCEVEPGAVIDLPAGDYVCVTVSDNGSGMTPDVIARVFEPFYTTKAVGKGTGLGLSQVYGFARQSGGGVHIASTVGRGTEIRLYLPPLADAAAEEQRPARIEAEDAIADGRRLLLVEDDPGVAAVALDMLEGFGLTVVRADNSMRALDALARSSFDMMLTDIVMPGGMSGVELARIAARDWPAMRIVLTSGYAGDDVDEVLADAPWPLLSKPYSSEALRKAVALALTSPAPTPG